MTQRSFQTTLARLAIDPDFRDHIRATGMRDLGDVDLTELEQQRLVAILGDRGLDATRILHESFRLTKLYTSLPLTRVLMGPDRLSKEIRAFWKAYPPESHYFLAESIAFCDFLMGQMRAGLRVRYLAEIVAYERASLELRQPRITSRQPKLCRVKFDHDPVILFEQLMKGQRPRAVPRLSCVLVGRVDDKGEITWRLST